MKKIIFLLAALAAGCTPQSDVKLPEEFAQIQVVVRSENTSPTFTVSKVVVDGITYVVASSGSGLSICRAPSK